MDQGYSVQLQHRKPGEKIWTPVGPVVAILPSMETGAITFFARMPITSRTRVEVTSSSPEGPFTTSYPTRGVMVALDDTGFPGMVTTAIAVNHIGMFTGTIMHRNPLAVWNGFLWRRVCPWFCARTVEVLTDVLRQIGQKDEHILIEEPDGSYWSTKIN